MPRGDIDMEKIAELIRRAGYVDAERLTGAGRVTVEAVWLHP